MSKRSDEEVTTRLHRRRGGYYQVGASPFLIRREDGKLPWKVYGTQHVGEEYRVPGRWQFATLREAKARAFALAYEGGWAP